MCCTDLEPEAEEEHTELSGDPPADRSVTDAGLGSTEAIPVVADRGLIPPQPILSSYA